MTVEPEPKPGLTEPASSIAEPSGQFEWCALECGPRCGRITRRPRSVAIEHARRLRARRPRLSDRNDERRLTAMNDSTVHDQIGLTLEEVGTELCPNSSGVTGEPSTPPNQYSTRK
jgi:hypothetical protein